MAILNKHKLLFVDDEQSVLNAIRRELSILPLGRHAYELEFFTNPEHALERAKEQLFQVVISDYRMPQMNGTMFLKSFAQVQPDCTRIVVSGQADMTALTQLLNEAQIFRFIPKPWDSEFLKQSIAQAVALHLRNVRAHRTSATTETGAWEFSQREYRLTTPDGIPISLTNTETTLVAMMLRADGKPASRKQLIEALGQDFLTYDERRIEVKLSRLRKKVRDLSGGQEPIRSEWGAGYLFISPCRIC